ncbi:MAG: Rrf2 family transcriptional regulator [Acidobacteria bacterium]|jgi:Rrf2 family protein|nr:Rrf2 family transcriptional regulator [Acidobacteriota bacterium]
MFIMNMTDRYRLLLLIELAGVSGGSIQVAEISRRRGIPTAYLAQLVADLSRRGIIAARRGPNGGVRLALDPGEVPVNDLFAAPAPADLASPALRRLQERLGAAWEEATSALTLQDLLRWERSAYRQPEYVI